MKNNFHLISVIEMLDIFFESQAPFDIVMSKYFKNHKWIGSHDRRYIADFAYSIFRNYEKVKFFVPESERKSGKFFVMSFLKFIQKKSDSEIAKIFSEKLPECNDVVPKYAELNYPEWMEKYFQKAFHENFENEMRALNKKAYIDIRVNSLKSNKESVKKILSTGGFSFEDTKYAENCIRITSGRIGRDNEIISRGLAEIQDEGSQLIAEFCGASSSDTVVDFCAGAGGKTLAISAAMKNKGRIFALDKYEERLENAKLRFRRAGINNIFCQQITRKWLKRHAECADIVLVDAPCSGTGTWRRNPDMRAKFSPKDLEELIAVQAEILEKAKNLVRKGGKLIYATCSVLKEEDEEQIEKFITKFPEFYLDKKANIMNLCTNGCLRLSPLRNGTDGFFAASLLRS